MSPCCFLKIFASDSVPQSTILCVNVDATIYCNDLAKSIQAISNVNDNLLRPCARRWPAGPVACIDNSCYKAISGLLVHGRSNLDQCQYEGVSSRRLMKRMFISCALVAPMLAPMATATPAPAAAAAPAAQQSPPSTQYHALALNDDLIHQAITDTLNATPAPNVLPSQATFSTGGSNDEKIMTRAFQDAKVGDCLHEDAMKLTPPRIGPVMLTQAFAAPFWAYAILSGKCH